MYSNFGNRFAIVCKVTMNYTEPFLRKVETAQEEQYHHLQSGVSYRAAVAADKILQVVKFQFSMNLMYRKTSMADIEISC